jgi:PERQ amino acid-rich with GYF domain-containing protein
MKAGNGLGREAFDNQQGSQSSSIVEEKEDGSISRSQHSGEDRSFFATTSPQALSAEPRQYSAVVGDMDSVTSIEHRNGFAPDGSTSFEADVGPPPGLIDLAAVEWSYKDPTGQVQGAFPKFLVLTLFKAL